MCGCADLFFAFHRFSVVKIGHLRTRRSFVFALLVNAALGFKIFSIVALRLNIIAQCPPLQ